MQSLHFSFCEKAELTCAHLLQALSPSDVLAVQTHIALCVYCQRELESLRPVVDRFVSWSSDMLRPTMSLQAQLARRIAAETGKPPVTPPAPQWSEPEWEEIAPGIECKLLAADTERYRASMLLRLAPGASYPAQTHGDMMHGDIRELHLLDGELWIGELRLVAGDYNYGARGTGDERVWSETGCTCVLISQY
jgi:hypothetical protein